MTRLRTLLLAAFAATGCITTSFQKGLVESRARFDLDCQQVDVAELGNDTFGARGCGKRSTYIVVCTGGSARTDLCDAVADTPQAHQE
jgi:hypothetical protein